MRVDIVTNMPAPKMVMKRLLHKKQGGLCCYCGRAVVLKPKNYLKRLGMCSPPPPNFATLEHLQRRADGGTDHPDNLALACVGCNNTRGTRSWVEFKTLMSRAV